jgi:RNA 3'-terminal phosphate cyclase (ATP)
VLQIDGSMGEGGGQVLRTALTLSVALGRPFRIARIRAGRRRPGLQRQHLVAVEAAAAIGAANVTGAALGSSRLVFEPAACVPGRYRFDIGSAGSACLVAQTLLPALARCDRPSQVRVVGGTHNRAAPPFEFLSRTYLPLLSRLGVRASVRLDRHGFEPAGGGVLMVDVHPARALGGLDLLQRGRITSRRARAVVSGLPQQVAERELGVVADRLGWAGDELAVEAVEADCPGNVLLLELGSETVTEVFVGFGLRGKPAEAVAGEAVGAAQRYLQADVPVGEHLADQLLVPLALGGGGRFVSPPPSAHFATNVEVIRSFLDIHVTVVPLTSTRVRVEVGPRPS